MTRSARAAALLLPVVMAVLIPAGTASAHEGAAQIQVDTTESAPLTVDITARVAYQIDADPATPRTFTVTPITPDGTEQPPVDLQRTDVEGTYALTLVLASEGEWSLRFETTFPPGELIVVVPVTADPAATTTLPPDALTDDSLPADALADGTAPPGSEAAGPATLVESGEGNGPPGLLVVGLVVFALATVAVIVAAVVLRRRAGNDADPPPND